MTNRSMAESIWQKRKYAARFVVAFGVVGIFCLSLWGCVKDLNLNGKKEKIEYTICKDSNLPEQLKVLLEERKTKPGTFIYRNSTYIYLVVCYGKKDYSGFSVKIEECWKSEDILFLRTQLMGPAIDEDIIEAETFPYLVVRCKQMNVFCVIDS